MARYVMHLCGSYSARSAAAALKTRTSTAAVRCQDRRIATAGIAAEWNAKDLCFFGSFSANEGEMWPPES